MEPTEHEDLPTTDYIQSAAQTIIHTNSDEKKPLKTNEANLSTQLKIHALVEGNEAKSLVNNQASDVNLINTHFCTIH